MLFSQKSCIFASDDKLLSKGVAWNQEIIELLGTMGYVKRLKTSSRQKHAKNLIAILLENKKVAENQPLSSLSDFVLGRDEATRTPDPYVPNVVRYQLRYIPIFCKRLQNYKIIFISANFLLFLQLKQTIEAPTAGASIR